jgi:hypothetical protein
MSKTDASTLVQSMSKMPTLHRSMRNDPVGTLKTVAKSIGVDPENIDAGTLELVASLSDEELRLVDTLSSKALKIGSLAKEGHDGAIIF